MNMRTITKLVILTALCTLPCYAHGYISDNEPENEKTHSYDVLSNYNVNGEGGFFSDFISSTLKGVGSAVTEPYYAIRRELTRTELNKLPLYQLDGINKKFDTVLFYQNKIEKAKQDLFSSSTLTRTKALKDIEYYNTTLKHLELNPDEQHMWDAYGKQYLRLKAELEQVDADKANLLGTRNISWSQAELLMRQYNREEINKQLGIDENFKEKACNYIKDSFSSAGAFGQFLGTILSYIITIIIVLWTIALIIGYIINIAGYIIKITQKES